MPARPRAQASPSAETWASSVAATRWRAASPAPAAVATGLPPKVVPCWPAVKQRRSLRAEGRAGADREAAAQALGQGDGVGQDPSPSATAGTRTSCRCGRCRSGPRRGSAGRRRAWWLRGRPSGSPAGSGRTPASPWIGSRKTAATVSSTAARSASTSPNGMCSTPPGSGSNGVAVGVLRGQGQGAHGAAVEGALQGDDLGARRSRRCRVAPGQLERGLVGFGAGVGEEHLGPGRGAGPAPAASRPARSAWGW